MDEFNERIKDLILSELLSQNPLPWSVNRDWTHEVITSKGVVIAKCASHDEALFLIRHVEDYHRRSRAELEAFETERVLLGEHMD